MPTYLDTGEVLAMGVIAATQTFTTRSVTQTSVESSPMMTVSSPVEAGRLYRVEGSARVVSSGVAGVAAETVEVRITQSLSGGASGSGGTDADAERLTTVGGAGAKTLRPKAWFFCDTGGTATWTLVVVRTQGSATVTAEAGNGTPTFVIEDTGPVPGP